MFKKNNENDLIGRTINDVNGVEGVIISAISRKQTLEVSVRFKDGINILDTRFTFQEWLDNSIKE